MVSARGVRESAASRPARFHDLAVRAGSGLVLVAAALASAWAGGLLFTAFWFLAALAIGWEWTRLVGGDHVASRVAVTWLALLAVSLAAGSPWPVAVIAVAAPVGAVLAGRSRRLWAAGAPLYAGIFLLAVLAIRRSEPDGFKAVLWLFAVVWATDIAAYFAGRFIGGPKIWPRVSPSKTWSGTLVGISAGAVLGTFVALRRVPGLETGAGVLGLSLLVAAVSQAGDAFESAMKRHFGVKDASRLIPGHGGVMDRLDGFVAATVAAFLIGWLHDPAAPIHGLFRWA